MYVPYFILNYCVWLRKDQLICINNAMSIEVSLNYYSIYILSQYLTPAFYDGKYSILRHVKKKGMWTFWF